ncbi:MAG: hypothetical protein AB1716_15905 [Planctomycetota bacterium]
MGKTAKLCTLVLLFGMAAAAIAEESLALPGYGRTYSSTSGVRGYWFQAPTNFVMTGFRVPNEGGHAEQTLEVVRFNGNTPPPAYPNTTNDFVSLYRQVRQAAGAILRPATPIAVAAGEVIGIYGGCGDAGSNTLYMSYGTPPGPFGSAIFGQPTTLTRSGMQYNLINEPMHNIWQEAAYEVSRVEMYYDIPEPAAFALLGLLGLTLRRR